MKKVMVVAPHADDETLGCGGTLLRHLAEGDQVFWLVATEVSEEFGFSAERVNSRQQEIHKVAKAYGFKDYKVLRFRPAGLDRYPLGDLIGQFSEVISEFKPEVIYAPFRNDAHSDHAVVFDAVVAASKSFRYPFVKRVLMYETISETDYGMKPESSGFRPNVYVQISELLKRKLEILEIFESELGDFPFPRSQKAVESLAYIRGSQSNSQAAEAFMLVKEII